MSRLKMMDTPIFWVEGHPGTLDRESWKIEVVGLCENPGIFNWDDIMKMKKTIAEARLTSVTRFSVKGRWGGVKISDLLREVKPSDNARFCRFWSVKKIYDTSIPMETALQEKTLLAYEFDGELLEEDYGGPVRGFCPYLWGYKSAKSVVKIELMDHYISGFWEKRGYSDDALIIPGMVRDINNGGRLKMLSLEDCI
ncbi:MAG TPA: molybdopterin-dependent oxidoreductase [Syntrophorhabdaceae bacterium]|nr:molybdopterin-dependent oxidoreductase [Syntrophorhabdaceae bacterium]